MRRHPEAHPHRPLGPRHRLTRHLLLHAVLPQHPGRHRRRSRRLGHEVVQQLLRGEGAGLAQRPARSVGHPTIVSNTRSTSARAAGPPSGRRHPRVERAPEATLEPGASSRTVRGVRAPGERGLTAQGAGSALRVGTPRLHVRQRPWSSLAAHGPRRSAWNPKAPRGRTSPWSRLGCHRGRTVAQALPRAAWSTPGLVVQPLTRKVSA
jgi:hypothetical protein